MHLRMCKTVFRLIIPAAALVSEVQKQGAYVCKPSDLPIYTHDNACPITLQQETSSETRNAIENVFTSVRESVANVNSEIKAYYRVGEQYLTAGVDNIQWLFDYLAEEDNTTPKYGAIAIGGLTGFIFGLRGGLIKRTLYTGAGALSMTAVCYPEQAKEYSKIGFAEAKKYFTIAYNFAYGVKKDDPPLELPKLPKVPSSISEVWEIASDIGKSAASIVIGPTDQQPVEESIQKVTEKSSLAIDPVAIVTQAHEEATNKQCHCPVGTCLGHNDGNNVISINNPKEQ